jgi:lipopolysaccharide/colanic/teichoic acid biosynthesis glycosyltransferase
MHMGRVLHATGLDELPQIFNIFRGEMSFVGPGLWLWGKSSLMKRVYRGPARRDETCPGTSWTRSIIG